MLNKLQALQGNIQVCCRTRPPSYQELANGGKICIDAADDTELMCYDGYVFLVKRVVLLLGACNNVAVKECSFSASVVTVANCVY